MVPVEVEDPEPQLPAGSVRRRRWIGIGVIAALVAAVIATNVVDAWRERERRAALAQLGWVLPRMDGPLQEVWRAPGGFPTGAAPELIITSGGGDGQVSAIDTSTGEVRWSRGDTGSYTQCWPLGAVEPATDPMALPVSEALVCYPWMLFRDPLPGESTTVAVVDPSTGAEQASVTLAGYLLGQEAVGQDLLLAAVDAGGTLVVTRWQPRTGRELWTYRSAPGRMADSTSGWGFGVVGGTVLVDADSRVRLDLATGLEVSGPEGAEPESLPLTFLESLPDGGTVEWSLTPAGVVAGGQVVEADGRVRFTFSGEPLHPWHTDGSTPNVLLVQDRRAAEVTGLDVRTGEELWRLDLLDPNDSLPVLQIDGTLLLLGYSSVMAIDIRDGTVLWQLVTQGFSSGVATDGDLVLIGRSYVPRGVLVALDLRTGVEAWRVPIAGPVQEVRVVGQNVLVTTGEQVIALR